MFLYSSSFFIKFCIIYICQRLFLKKKKKFPYNYSICSFSQVWVFYEIYREYYEALSNTHVPRRNLTTSLNHSARVNLVLGNFLVYVVKFLIKFQIKEITTGLRPLGMHFVFGHYLNR